MSNSNIALSYFAGSFWAAWVFEDRVNVRLYDGSSVSVSIPDTDYFRKLTYNLGYGEDRYWCVTEYILLHCMLAETLDNTPSALLWNKAYRRTSKSVPECVEQENKRVLAVQAAFNNKDDVSLDKCREVGISKHIVNSLFRQLRRNCGPMTSEWSKTSLSNLNPILPRNWDKSMEQLRKVKPASKKSKKDDNTAAVSA